MPICFEMTSGRLKRSYLAKTFGARLLGVPVLLPHFANAAGEYLSRRKYQLNESDEDVTPVSHKITQKSPAGSSH